MSVPAIMDVREKGGALAAAAAGRFDLLPVYKAEIECASREEIEAVRLADTLATMRGSKYPALSDLRDASVTTMGHGQFSELALAAADTEIGKKIGFLPQGVARASGQEDFYRQLKELRLEKFRTAQLQRLDLDLREKLNVKSEGAALADLRRSFFLHRLRVLGVHFAALRPSRQEGANWGEYWELRWTPEVEIEVAESALLGDTIEGAAAYALKERAEFVLYKLLTQRRYAVYEHFSVKMVKLVLHHTCEITVHPLVMRLHVLVKIAYAYTCRTDHLLVYCRQTETAFLHSLRFAVVIFYNMRINVCLSKILILRKIIRKHIKIDNRQTYGLAYLRSCQSDAVGLGQRFKHILDQIVQSRKILGYILCNLSQYRLPVYIYW